MDIDTPLSLLGGLTPQQFMKRHWQKKPLLVRAALPGFVPPVARSQLLAWASCDDVESRLIIRRATDWQLRSGPMPRRALPPLAQPGWTLLVQGVDLLHPAVHALRQRFRFVPEARLDDVMVSYATDGGGVGPHFDSYDVFLLQAAGSRRWRIGRQRDLSLQDGLPLKILRNFQPEQEFVLEPGDMLYLPPRYAHDGIAEGECQTYSIGFRAPSAAELARELLPRLAEDAAAASEGTDSPRYRDAQQPATAEPGRLPTALFDFARQAVDAALADPQALERALGEYLTEPKAQVWFEAGCVPRHGGRLVLDARSRMLHHGQHVFLNGESWRASGRDGLLMRCLADQGHLDAAQLRRASPAARELLAQWCEAGWLHEATQESNHE